MYYPLISRFYSTLNFECPLRACHSSIIVVEETIGRKIWAKKYKKGLKNPLSDFLQGGWKYSDSSRTFRSIELETFFRSKVRSKVEISSNSPSGRLLCIGVPLLITVLAPYKSILSDMQ